MVDFFWLVLPQLTTVQIHPQQWKLKYFKFIQCTLFAFGVPATTEILLVCQPPRANPFKTF
jgi:hypothetical protein